MPVKLIGTIILLILVTIFAGVNLDNKCDITFIFYTFKDIPVFMTVIISFAIGAILMIPFTLGRGKKKKCQKPAQAQQTAANQTEPKEESKTLFDFKIKREAKPEKTKTENPQKNKKSLFGFRKAKADSENTASATSGNQADSSESTGEPV